MSPKGCFLTSQLPCKGYWNYLSAMKTQQYKEISWAADTLEYWMVLRPEPLSPQGSLSRATWMTYCWWELFPAFLHSLPWQRPYPTQDHAPKKFKLAWQNSTLFSVLIPVLISCGSTWFTPATSLDWEKLSINAAKRSHKDDAMWWRWWAWIWSWVWLWSWNCITHCQKNSWVSSWRKLYTDITGVSFHKLAPFKISRCLFSYYAPFAFPKLHLLLPCPLEWLWKSLWNKHSMIAVTHFIGIWIFILRYSMHFA